MKKEVSAGVVIYRMEDHTPKYLLLFKKYKTEYWDLPKGNVEPGEDPKQTAEREAQEEAGITDLKFVPGFREKVHWYYKLEGELRYKEVIFFLAETKTMEAKVSHEHERLGWFTFEEALNNIKHKTTRELLKKAHAFIEKLAKEGLDRFLK